MQKLMTPRWTSVVFLAAALVLSPFADVAQAQDQARVAEVVVQELSFEPAAALGFWEVVGGNPEASRTFVELQRYDITSSPDLIVAAGFANRFDAVLLGEFDGKPGYYVGVLGEVGSGSDGDHSFYTIAKTSRLDIASDLAQLFATRHSGLEPPTTPTPLCDCEDCGTARDTDRALCAVKAGLCETIVLTAFSGCVLACVLPAACALCIIGFIAGQAACMLDLVICERAATSAFVACEANCNI